MPWYILVLNSNEFLTETEDDPADIKRSIQRTLKSFCRNIRVVVPASVTEFRTDKKCEYWGGYAFVSFTSEYPEVALSKLSGTQYVSRALMKSRTEYATLSEDQVKAIQRQVESLSQTRFHPGDRVEVLEGYYKGLSGDVVVVFDDLVQIGVSFRSKQSLVSLPPAFLKLEAGSLDPQGSGCLSEETDAIYRDLLNSIRFLSSLPSCIPLDLAEQEVYRCEKRWDTLYRFVQERDRLSSYFGPFVDLQTPLARYLKLKRWVDLRSSLV